MIVGIPLLIKATILCIQNILKDLLENRGILKGEAIFLHNIITIIPHSVLYSSSYYIINPRISTSSNFDDTSTNLDDYFSSFASSSNTVYDNILVT
ncbi:EM14S01-3B_G0031080.mRNA.1.CDS.1 [Saccharomyces cerevisiae]|nr:EM14S01-3B_G0031080.mRNA.1.CDS.1 [Saccharomyces cerevisiae]